MRDKTALLAVVLLLFGCAGGRTGPLPAGGPPPADKALTKGVADYRQGCYERSLAYLFQAHELYTAADDRIGAATALNNIGNVYRAQKDLSRSLRYYDAAAAIFSRASDERGSEQALINRASVLLEAGRLEEAEAALAAARSGEQPSVSWMLTNGILEFRKGALEAAEAELAGALKRADATAPEVLSGIHYALSRLFLETGRHPEAARHAEAARVVDRQAGAVRRTADDLLLLCTVRQRTGQPSAGAACERAMMIYALLGDAAGVGEAAEMLQAAGTESVHPLTLDFVERWLRGDVRSGICR